MNKTKDFISAVTICILVLLNVLLLIKNKRIANDQYAYTKPSKIIQTDSELLHTILSISEVYTSELDVDSLLTVDLQSLESDSTFAETRLVIFLGKNVCSPCVQRLFDELNKRNSHAIPERTIVISEAWNLREVILLKDRYNFAGDVYFKKGNLIKAGTAFEKPVFFLLGPDLKPTKAMVFHDNYAALLPSYFQLIKDFLN